MLFADKQQLQRQLEVDLLNLRQKELDHFTTCCLTLSGPSALIAGFAYTGIAEVGIPDGTHWVLEMLYYGLTVAAMLFQVAATIRSSLVALMGPALALRGKAGAMHRSVEAMEPCFKGAWQCFLAGMLCWLMSTLLTLFIMASHWAIAAVISVGIILGTVQMYRDIMFISVRFNLPLHQVERGSFSQQEVRSMFRARRSSLRASESGSPRSSRRDRFGATSATSRFLIQAAEKPACDRSLKGLTKRQTVSIDSRAAAPCTALAEVETPRASARGTAESADGGCVCKGSINTSFEAEEFRRAREVGAGAGAGARGVTSSRRSVRFEVDDSEQPVGVGAAQARRGGTPRKEESVASRVRSKGAKVLLLGDGGYLPCVGAQRASAEGRRSTDVSQSAGDGPATPPSAESTVNVVLTIRDGKRLRWPVPGSTTISALREQAEVNFETEVEHLLDAQGVAFAHPASEQVFRYARNVQDGPVAYFEVVPKGSYATSSFPKMLWSNFLGQI